MATFVWLLFSTAIGAWVGNHFFEAAYIIGAVIGLMIGLAIRYGGGEILESIGDILGDILSGLHH